LLEKILSLVEENFPIPGRFKPKLPYDVADLSRLLTAARGERDSGYLNRPNMLSAYLRYFLPWNVFRLCRLFSLKPGFSAGTDSQSILPALSDGDAITDLGSGPLTLPIALWVAFPQLRTVKLEFRCVDKSAAILDAGYKLFRALCAVPNSDNSGNTGTWKIKTIHDSIDAPVRGKPAKLVTAVNVFNEMFTGMQRSIIIKNAEKSATLLCKLCADNGSILVVEPGNPQGGAFISALRTALLKKGKYPAAPCTHSDPCPLPGISSSSGSSDQVRSTKAKWCHFAFDTDAAPEALHSLSIEAGIPKERATFSFLLAGSHFNAAADLKRMHINAGADLKRSHIKTASIPASLPIRIVSDTFPVPFQKAGLGCYGCTERGMVLVAGNRSQFTSIKPGSLLTLPLPSNEQRDPKTGALIIPL
jgi:hypothetical protein